MFLKLLVGYGKPFPRRAGAHLWVPRIDWLGAEDVERVLEIEQLSFDYPWPPSDFERALRRANVLAVVLRLRGEVCGYAVYAFYAKAIELLNLAVAPHIRRRGLGRLLVDQLKTKLRGPRKMLGAVVSERNLEAQWFFAAIGFRAEKVLRDYYCGGSDYLDGYRFGFRLPPRGGKGQGKMP
jgi:ribosomal-protein-alanine N-acetyltransferase